MASPSVDPSGSLIRGRGPQTLAKWCGTIAVVGYYVQRVAPWHRVSFLAAGLALLYPAAQVSGGLAVNLAGLAAAALLLWRGAK